MAKKKDKKKSGTSGKKERAKQAKAAKAAARVAKAAAKQEKKDAARAKKAGTTTAAPAGTTTAAPAVGGEQPVAAAQAPQGATGGAEPPQAVDQVAVLKLALRDTEAKLVAAEHRLRQVQQQLDDERRALAEAAAPSLEEQEAVVDAAVAETVAEVVAAELATVAAAESADAADLAATTLEDAAEVLDAVLAEEAAALEPGAGGGRESHADAVAREDAEAAFTGAAGTLTPPLPEQGSDDVPNESWTLVHLRKEAERRGISGVSNLTKAALIERLRA